MIPVNDLIKKFSQLDKQKQIAVAAGIAAVLLLDVFFVMRWQFSFAARQGKRAAELRRTITEIKKKSKEMAAHKQADQAAADKLKKMVSAEDLPVLLQKISNLAKEHNAKVVQINHATESAGQQPGKGKAVQQPAAKAAALNVRLELLGNYHDIGALLWAFEEASEPLVIDDLKIGREVGEEQRQRVGLTIRTFIGE